MEKNDTNMRAEGKKFTVEVSEPSQCKRVLSIEIPPEVIEKEEVEVFKKLRSELKIPGFRRGRIPEKYIWKNYGDVIHADAVQNLLPGIYEEALVQEGIDVIGSPKFDNVNAKKGESVKVDITVEVRPEVKIENYRNIIVDVEKVEIDEKKVEEALKELQERMATYKVVLREARKGDLLIVDYGPLREDGEVDESRVSRNYPLDLDNQSILKEFREGLLGVSTGEEKDIEVRYPQDFPDEGLAGRSRVFRVSVREIKEKVLPELNDEFVRQMGSDMKTLDDLKRRIRDDLEEEELKRFNHEVEEKVIDEIIKNEPFDVPQVMVENYIRSILEEDRKRRPNLASEEEREREVRELFSEAAVRTVKKYFVIEAIKEQEKIHVSEEELQRHIEDMAKNTDVAEEIRRYYSHPQHKDRLINELRDEKVLKLLRDSAITQ